MEAAPVRRRRRRPVSPAFSAAAANMILVVRAPDQGLWELLGQPGAAQAFQPGALGFFTPLKLVARRRPEISTPRAGQSLAGEAYALLASLDSNQ